jgi:hypothetical protein
MRSRTNVGRRSVLYQNELSNNGYNFQEYYGDGDTDDTIQKKRSRWTMLILGPMVRLWRSSCRRTLFSPSVISAFAILSSLISIQFVDSLLVTIASVLTTVVGLLVLLQQRKLRRLGNLRRQHNELRRRVNFFHQERERLLRVLARHDHALANLHFIPQELQKLSNNQDVNRLTQIVDEQRVLQEAIRKKIQQRVMQQLLSVVVHANSRDDGIALGSQDIENAILRLNMIRGLEFNETRFREILAEDPSIRSIFQMLRSMQERDDEFQYSQPAFVINPPRTAKEAAE